MTHRPHSSTWAILFVAFTTTALLVTDSAEGARWYEDYDLAVEYIETGVCSTEAIEALGAAVVDKNRPKRNVKTYAQRRIDYLPYYQLARAHLLCGNTDLAQQYLQRSRSYLISSEDELGPVESEILVMSAVNDAEPTVPPVNLEALETRRKAAEKNLEGARGALNSTDNSLALAVDLAVENPHWANQRDNSARLIESLAAAIGDNHRTENLLALADSAHSATEITRSLDALTIQINRAVEDHRAAMQSMPTPQDMLAEVRQTPSPLPVRAEEIDEPVPPLQRPLIPEKLRNAATAYVSGNYASVLTILDNLRVEEPKAQAAALLIKAAAGISLATIEDDRSIARSLTKNAEADILACRRLNPGLRPDPSFFPPQVVRLFAPEPSRNPKRAEEDLS